MGARVRAGGTRRWRGVAAALILVSVASVASGPALPPSLRGAIYWDPSYSPQERAADLVSRMTLAEKAGQMISSMAPAIPRLGVRAYGWWNEAIHGVSREQTVDRDNPPVLVNTTMYPVSLSLGSSWDPALAYRVATAVSDEAREVVRDNTLDLTFYSPTVNLARDPRWGRNDETYGEDPVLTAAMGTQFVNGMQGKDTDGKALPEGGGYLKTATTVKHYAANNSEFNRRTGSSDMDERTLREYYTAQFRDIVRRSAPASIMTAYNEVNGVPASANVHLLQTLGRQTFGFDGYYTSDCDSISEIEHGHHWIPSGSPSLDTLQRHALANAAGVDLECQQGYHDEFNYANALPDAVRQHVKTPSGTYTQDYVDSSLVRLFTARIRLGEFDEPARVGWVRAARARVPAGSWVNSDANQAITQTPQRLALAREAAQQSIVLLENSPPPGTDRPVLPLVVPSTGAYRIAVVGPMARPDTMYLGGYSSAQGPAGKANQVNAHDGLLAAVHAVNPDATVDYFPGAPETLDAYDVVVVCAGTDAGTAAEDTDRQDLALPGDQTALIRDIAARNPHTVVYLETIGPVDVDPFVAAVPALLWSSYNGQRKGEALADVLLGRVNPSGHLPFTWYRDVRQLPPIGDYGIRPAGDQLGRTYQYFAGDVSYPFGYGGSYTTFGYSDLRVDRSAVDADDTIIAGVDITNTGPVAGAEVVQLYAASPSAAALQRPVKRLLSFLKIMLHPGQTARADFAVPVADLAYFDEKSGRFAVDTGRYELLVGDSSAQQDRRASASVAVSGALTERPATLTAAPRAGSDPAGGGGRIVFRPGTTIEAQLTLAMTDDALYGYLGADRSRPLPDGCEVSYRSSRPSVLGVDGKATLRTVSPGVATVTATVRHPHGTVSTSFVVAVRA